ncbi:hypothetical protein O181_067170 [Austropuccinia psidii MF-1]|uniref:Uncharacterized protein n=1 Tax=Austropuccinia psidii MF-1 TaxID=1389203 RepID=A0A9Q3I5U0_9BASI|nr:hypothetical protein [Austropuccinia psidii MF-1]
MSKCATDSWRFEMENSFEKSMFNIERNRPMSWFLKQKERLTSLHTDMSEAMIHRSVLRKFGGDLEHAIRSRFIEAFSPEDYINSMADITTRTKIGRNWYKPPVDNKTSGKPISKPNKPHEKAPFNCNKCGSTCHLANNFPKKTRINEIEIEKEDDTKEANNVSLDESESEPSEEEELTDKISIKKEIFPLSSQKGILTYHSTVMFVWILYMCNMLRCRKPNLPELKVLQLDHLVSLES